MNKIGRGRSEDPVQESLRESKAKWNEAVKGLISNLISLKRGINGRGDSKAGLPTSNIKDPFPSEIGSFLRELSSYSNNVFDQANGIINEQAHYSESRRKPVEHEQHTASLNDLGLIVEASWVGSRIWSRLSLLKLEKSVRIARLRMIKDGADLLRQFKDLELDLLRNDPVSIPSASTIGVQIGLYVADPFMSEFDILIQQMSLSEINNTEAKPEVEPEVKGKTVKELKINPKSKPNPVPEIKPIPEEIKTSDIAAYEDFELKKENFAQIANNVTNIESVFVYMRMNKDITYEKDSKQIDHRLKQLVIKCAAVKTILRNSTDINLEEVDKEFQAIQNIYEYLLEKAQEVFGVMSFKEMILRLPKIIKVRAEENSQDLEKFANNIAQRWLLKQKLKVFPDIFKRYLVGIVKTSERCREKLHLLLNQLESTTSHLSDIDRASTAFVSEVINLMAGMSNLDDLYFQAHRRVKKDINNPLLRKDEVRKFRDIIKSLHPYTIPIKN